MSGPTVGMGAPTVAPHELEALLVYATRYALGRQTYAVDDVATVIAREAPRLSARTRSVLARDIAEAAARGNLGADFDARRWRDALRALTASTDPIGGAA